MTAILLLSLLGSYTAARIDQLRPAGLDAALRSVAGLGAIGTTARAHALFCHLFDFIYGGRALSAQRVGASIISTSVGLLVIVLAIGPRETLFVELVDFVGSLRAVASADTGAESATIEDLQRLLGLSASANTLILALFFLLPLNFAADFVSLMETRFVLSCGRDKGIGLLVVLTVLDLGLTAIIFGLPYVTIGYVIDGADGVGTAVDVMVTRNLMWPFLLTTFITSAIWLLFASCALMVRIICLHPLTEKILDLMTESKRPTMAFSTIAYVVVIVLWFPISYGVAMTAPTPLPRTGDSDDPVDIAIGRQYRAYFADEQTVRVSFAGRLGTLYVIETDPLLVADTRLTVSRGGTELAEDDDSGPGLGSRIEMRAEEDGTYVVELDPFSLLGIRTVGPLSTFDFVVREGAASN